MVPNTPHLVLAALAALLSATAAAQEPGERRPVGVSILKLSPEGTAAMRDHERRMAELRYSGEGLLIRIEIAEALGAEPVDMLRLQRALRAQATFAAEAEARITELHLDLVRALPAADRREYSRRLKLAALADARRVAERAEPR